MGDGRRSTAGWVEVGGRVIGIQAHQPQSGTAKGVLVLIPPVGREADVTYRLLRTLAVRAAEGGWLAVRMDLTGDGESQSVLGEDLPCTWVEDVVAVVETVKSWAPGASVHLVGLRLGALVAAAVPVEARDSVLAWEPVTPKQWLKEQRTLRVLSLPLPRTTIPGLHEFVGSTLTDAQRASLSDLSMPEEAQDVRVVVDEDHQRAADLYATEVSLALVPPEVVRDVLSSLPAGGEPRPVRVTPTIEAVRVVDGRKVVLRHETWGRHAFPVVVTHTAGGARNVTLLMVAGSSEAKSGPSGLWAQLAPELAAHDAQVVRADRRGAGELSDPSAEFEPQPYDRVVPEDTADLARQARQRFAGPIIGVGVCSGGWALATAADRVDFDLVVGYNTPCWYSFAPWLIVKMRWREAQERILGGEDVPLKRRVKDRAIVAGARVALGGWSGITGVAHLLGGSMTRRMSAFSPARYLNHMAGSDRRTRVEMLLGDADADLLVEIIGPHIFGPPLNVGSRPTGQRVPSLDHGLLSRQARLYVRRHLLQVLSEAQGPDVGVPAGSDSSRECR